MKIAFIVSIFPSMSETFILSKITGLIKLGHNIDIFAVQENHENKIHEDVIKYDLLKRTKFLGFMPHNRFKRLFKGIILFLCNFHENPQLILKSFNFFKYNCRDVFSLKYFYLTIPFLNFQKKEYDIIHAQFGPNGILALRLKDMGLLKGKKFVTTFYGYGATVTIQQLGVYDELFKRGDFFIADSNFVLNKIQGAGCPMERTKLLPNEIYLKKIKYNRKTLESDSVVNILSVGRLVEMKGKEYAIKAVANVIKKFPNVFYQIAGDGHLRDNFKELIIYLGVEKQIKLLGWVDDDELKYLYENSHIFLHPSITDSSGNQECQGMVLMEAQASGLPVIATRHGAFPEGILDGKSGFLVPERDVDALTEKLEYLIEHPEIWPDLGRAGRAFVEEKYDSKKLLKYLVEIYNAV